MYLLYIGLYVTYAQSLVSGGELDYDGWLQLRLWHSFSNSSAVSFVERGNVTISKLRSAAPIVTKTTLDSSQIKQLQNLAEGKGKYRLKIDVHTSKGSKATYLTSILMCQLIGSDLEDIMDIWLDANVEPTAINILSQGTCSVNKLLTNVWATNIRIKYPEAGPIPDTVTYIQKLEREKEARERGETKDNRSFFAKYWMYIVVGVIFIILSSASNPEAYASAPVGTVQRQ